MFARQMKTLLIHLCEGRALAIIRGSLITVAWKGGQFLQRMKDWKMRRWNTTELQMRPLQEEVRVAVLISRSPKEAVTYLHVHVREETAK